MVPRVTLELVVGTRHSSRYPGDVVSTADEKFLSLLELICQGGGGKTDCKASKWLIR